MDLQAGTPPFPFECDGLFSAIDLAGPASPDEVLRARIQAALQADPIASRGCDLVTIRCEDGAVLLSGLVQSARLRQRVVAVAGAVPGVAAVTSRLQVRPAGERSACV